MHFMLSQRKKPAPHPNRQTGRERSENFRNNREPRNRQSRKTITMQMALVFEMSADMRAIPEKSSGIRVCFTLSETARRRQARIV